MRAQALAPASESADYNGTLAALREREAWLTAVLDGAVDGIITIDERGIIQSVNPAVVRIFGYGPEEVIGRSVNMLMPVLCRKAHDDYIAGTLKAGEVNNAGRRRQVEGMRKDGSVFPMECGVSDVRYGGKRLFIGVVRDITERKKTEEALLASEEFSRTVLASSADCIEVMDCSGRVEFINEPGLRLLEADDPTAMTGQLWLDRWPDKEKPLVRAAIEKVNAGETGHFSAFCPTAKGTPKWWDILVTPVRGADGHIQKLVATTRDITEAKEAEEQIKLLMREVNHRAKNLLTVVMAVTRQMAGGEETKAFAERLSERLAALAASHDLLVRSEWRGVDAGDLVRSQLAHFKDLIGTRVVLDGPPAQLRPAAAQALGMALYELATNAGKYGALSNARGKVCVAWKIASDGENPHFKIRWSEENGPPLQPPGRRGFGHTVMVQVAEHALNAEVALDYRPSGLMWELSAETGSVIERDEARDC